jgi:hypothetical protein
MLIASDPRILLAICFVLFFIIIFLLQQGIGSCSEKLIPGFWTVSEQFKEQANLDQLILYFDDGKGYEYKGYMVVVVDGETVFNETMKFRITPKGYFKSDSYEFITEKDTGIMPMKMTMVLCPSEGHMELKCLNSKKIYARLFKDNQMSAKAILKVGNTSDVAETSDDDDENEEENGTLGDILDI